MQAGGLIWAKMISRRVESDTVCASFLWVEVGAFAVGMVGFDGTLAGLAGAIGVDVRGPGAGVHKSMHSSSNLGVVGGVEVGVVDAVCPHVGVVLLVAILVLDETGCLVKSNSYRGDFE